MTPSPTSGPFSPAKRVAPLLRFAAFVALMIGLVVIAAGFAGCENTTTAFDGQARTAAEVATLSARELDAERRKAEQTARDLETHLRAESAKEAQQAKEQAQAEQLAQARAAAQTRLDLSNVSTDCAQRIAEIESASTLRATESAARLASIESATAARLDALQRDTAAAVSGLESRVRERAEDTATRRSLALGDIERKDARTGFLVDNAPALLAMIPGAGALGTFAGFLGGKWKESKAQQETRRVETDKTWDAAWAAAHSERDARDAAYDLAKLESERDRRLMLPPPGFPSTFPAAPAASNVIAAA